MRTKEQILTTYAIIDDRKAEEELVVFVTQETEAWPNLPPQGLANAFLLCTPETGTGIIIDQLKLASAMGIKTHLLVDIMPYGPDEFTKIVHRSFAGLAHKVTGLTMPTLLDVANTSGYDELQKILGHSTTERKKEKQPAMLIKGLAGSGTTNMSLHKMMESLYHDPNAYHVHVNDEYMSGSLIDALGRLGYSQQIAQLREKGHDGKMFFVDYGHGADRWKTLRKCLENDCRGKTVYLYMDAPSITRMNNNKAMVVHQVGEDSHIKPWHRAPDTEFYSIIDSVKLECMTVRHRLRPGEKL